MNGGGINLKISSIRLANAFALSMTILWVLCSAVVWILPSFTWQVTEWWMHGMDLLPMGGWNLTFSSFIFGGITAVLSAWITGWILGWSWNLLKGK